MTRMELLVPRICLPLIACFPSLAIAGEGTDWYTSAYEEDFMQALTLIVLVVLALAFDHVWHLVVHSQMHSYKYGQLMAAASVHPTQQHHHAKHKHRVLKFELVSRAGTEFMTLGFLAFSIFTFNILGGFEALADCQDQERAAAIGDLLALTVPLAMLLAMGHTLLARQLAYTSPRRLVIGYIWLRSSIYVCFAVCCYILVLWLQSFRVVWIA